MPVSELQKQMNKQQKWELQKILVKLLNPKKEHES